MLLTPVQIKPKSFESTRNCFFVFVSTRGGCVSCLRECLGARLLSHSDQYPNLSEGADRGGGHELRRDRVPLQWRNQIRQSLEEGAGKGCSECVTISVLCLTSTPLSAVAQPVQGSRRPGSAASRSSSVS